VHIAIVIEYILKSLKSSAERHNTNIEGLTMKTITSVVDVTGLQAITRAILERLSSQIGVLIGCSSIPNLQEPTLFYNVLVLPNTAFAAIKGGLLKDRGPYLIKHHYTRSWKNKKGGE
jgi:hypothetical protein